jgi:hypothetical protein
VHRLTEDIDGSAVRTIHAGEYFEQRGLSCTVVTYDGKNFPATCDEIYSIESNDVTKCL